MHYGKSLASHWGWVSGQKRDRTEVRLQTGQLVHATKLPALSFGTPVSVELFDQRGDVIVGRILYAALQRRPSPDDRLALVDESNISGLGESSAPERWKFGAVKSFAAGLALDRLGYRIVFCADPCAVSRAYAKHQPSARAASALKWRWSRHIFEYGVEGQNADIGFLTAATHNSSALIVTGTDQFREAVLRRRFPWLDTEDGQRRIHRVEVHGDRITIPSLGLSELIPTVLFS